MLAPASAQERLDAVRTGLVVGAGIGALITLALAWRRQQTTEHDATERRLTALYVRAVDQLGSDKHAIRQGGLTPSNASPGTTPLTARPSTATTATTATATGYAELQRDSLWLRAENRVLGDQLEIALAMVQRLAEDNARLTSALEQAHAVRALPRPSHT